MSRLFGGVIQNGYVVRNIEAAIRHWIDVLGVGHGFIPLLSLASYPLNAGGAVMSVPREPKTTVSFVDQYCAYSRDVFRRSGILHILRLCTSG
jgi:hypothetical protein